MVKNRLERAIQCSAWQRDWQLANANQTSCSRSMRNRRHESSFPQLRGIKNSFAFQSREPALGPREKNLREHSSLPSNSIYTATLFSPLLLFYDKFKKIQSSKLSCKDNFFLIEKILRIRWYPWRDSNNQINQFFLLAFSSPIDSTKPTIPINHSDDSSPSRERPVFEWRNNSFINTILFMKRLNWRKRRKNVSGMKGKKST